MLSRGSALQPRRNQETLPPAPRHPLTTRLAIHIMRWRSATAGTSQTLLDLWSTSIDGSEPAEAIPMSPMPTPANRENAVAATDGTQE